MPKLPIEFDWLPICAVLRGGNWGNTGGCSETCHHSGCLLFNFRGLSNSRCRAAVPACLQGGTSTLDNCQVLQVLSLCQSTQHVHTVIHWLYTDYATSERGSSASGLRVGDLERQQLAYLR